MSIAWNYLDKRSAAMAALKDYRSMKAILATTAEQIANVRQDMVRIGGMRFEESAHGARNPQAGETRSCMELRKLMCWKLAYPENVQNQVFLDFAKAAGKQRQRLENVSCSLRIWREIGRLERKLERKEREQRATHTRLVLVKQMR